MKKRPEDVDFVFVYEVKNRELDNLFLVASYLKNKGYSVAFINAWESQFYLPKSYSAEVVVVSACYNDATYDYFTGHVASFRKVVNMRWEQVLINFYLDNLEDIYAFKEEARYVRHVCWGKREAEWAAKEYGIPSKNLPILGYLPLDFYRDELSELMIPKQKLFEKYGLDPQKKTLLFVSSFSTIGLLDIQVEENQQLFETEKKLSTISQMEILSWFSKILKNHHGIQIVYRYHPSEKSNQTIQKLANRTPGLFAISDLSMRHWICASDKIYNWCSSGMVEMLSSGKEVYVLRPFRVPHEIDYAMLENVEYVTSYQEFEQSALEGRTESTTKTLKNLEPWYDIQEIPAFIRIGNYLIETFQDSDYVCRPSKNNLFKRKRTYKVKKKIENTRAFIKIANYWISHTPKNKLSFRLQNLLEVERYNAEMQKDGSYAREKMDLNRVTDEEREKQLDIYQEVVARTCNKLLR